jgi:simple sugar transport system ATP-binding protein
VAAFLNRGDLAPETLGTYMLGLSAQTPEEMQAGLK